MSMRKLSCCAELWLDLLIKISLKLSCIVLFKTIEHKQTQIITIQALSNINTTLDFQVEIVGAGSLNIRICKTYWELVTMNFELKEKIRKITQVGRKINVQGKKSEWEVCLLFSLKICSIICAYFIPIIVLKYQLKISVKTSAKTRGFLSLIFFTFFYSTLEPFQVSL